MMNLINSPFASISDNSLSCKLCNVVVKSAKIWTAHINGKQHREKLLELKRSTAAKNEAAPKVGLIKKRPSAFVSENGTENAKRTKTVPSDFFDSNEPQSKKLTSVESNTILKSITTSKAKPDLDKPTVSENNNLDDQNAVASSSSSLPEGFFDDKKLDAKARNAEISDGMEEEWQRFQKELVQEKNVADSIVEDEDKRVHTERDISQIQEEMQDLSKFVELERFELERKTTLNAVICEPIEEEMQTDEEESDINFDELNSWRAKKF